MANQKGRIEVVGEWDGRDTRTKHRGTLENLKTDAIRFWPIVVFIIGYAVGGVWWAATVQAETSTLKKTVESSQLAKDLAYKHEVLIPEIQRTMQEMKQQQTEIRADFRSFQIEVGRDIKDILKAVKS